jgi:hypothetical protein
MYAISDEQIEYIISDIKRNGIELEDLQHNLVDHVCCILEQELKDGDDFKAIYQKTIQQFYKKELREIEDETIQLLTFKNYYAMKKLMIISGVFSAAAFLLGSVFKVMYWPGAGVLLASAIVVFSLLFLPLIFILKTRDASTQRNKWTVGMATLVGILYCLSALFILQHWPGARILWLSTLALSFFILLPLYFFTGIRKEETKSNTIVFSVIIIGVLGIQFTMTAIRQSPQTKARVYTYLQSEQLLQKMWPGAAAVASPLAQEIQNTCEQLKELIIEDAGLPVIPQDFEAKGISIKETDLSNNFFKEGKGGMLLQNLRQKVKEYNSLRQNSASAIPIENSILEPTFEAKGVCTSLFVLNNITQLQLFLASAERNQLAAK